MKYYYEQREKQINWKLMNLQSGDEGELEEQKQLVEQQKIEIKALRNQMEIYKEQYDELLTEL